MLHLRFLLGVFLSFLVLSPTLSCALEHPEENLSETGVTSKLGEILDHGIVLTDSDGQSVTVAELFSTGKPVILVPVYYDCPRLCGLVLSGLVSLINEVSLKIGKEYGVLVVSIDAEEKAPLAAKRRKEYQKQLTDQDLSADSWRFLVGEEAQIQKVMQAVGFGFKRDGDEFAHSAALFILTPEGKVSQYFTGIEFSAWDVRLALIDASMGGIGSAMDHVLLYCFRFDPSTGKYTLAAFNVMKIGGVLTLIAMGLLFYFAARKSPRAS